MVFGFCCDAFLICLALKKVTSSVKDLDKRKKKKRITQYITEAGNCNSLRCPCHFNPCVPEMQR